MFSLTYVPSHIVQGFHSNLRMKIHHFFRTFQDLIYQTISTYFYIVLASTYEYDTKTRHCETTCICNSLIVNDDNANVTELLHNLLHRGLTRAPQLTY